MNSENNVLTIFTQYFFLTIKLAKQYFPYLTTRQVNV